MKFIFYFLTIGIGCTSLNHNIKYYCYSDVPVFKENLKLDHFYDTVLFYQIDKYEIMEIKRRSLEETYTEERGDTIITHMEEGVPHPSHYFISKISEKKGILFDEENNTISKFLDRDSIFNRTFSLKLSGDFFNYYILIDSKIYKDTLTEFYVPKAKNAEDALDTFKLYFNEGYNKIINSFSKQLDNRKEKLFQINYINTIKVDSLDKSVSSNIYGKFHLVNFEQGELQKGRKLVTKYKNLKERKF